MFKQYSQILSHKRRRSKGSTIQVLSAAQSERASEAPTVNDQIETWVHSQLLDAQGEKHKDCFTSLAARIHKYDHVAQRGSDRFVEDLIATVTDEAAKPRESYLSSPAGNYASFLYPECVPERLELVAYLTELANFHDVENKEEQGCKPGGLDSPRAEVRKQLLDKVMAELTDKDGHDIIDCYRSTWLVTPEVPTADNCANLGDYVARRRLNAAIDVYWTLMGFAHGTHFGKEEQAIVRDALDAAERVMFFTNDYYSWPKDKRDYKARRVANVILFLMQHQDMSEDDARTKTKDLILESEKEFIRRRDDLYHGNPDLSAQLRKWMEVLGAALGGVHYWCKNAPRYDVPDEQFERSEDESESSEEEGSTDSEDTENGDEEDNEEKEKEEKEPEEVPVWTPLVNEEEATEVRLDSSSLLAPTRYMGCIASNEVPLALLTALNVWLQVPNRPFTFIKQVVDDLHHTTQTMSDIQDDSAVHHGKTTAHLVFGRAQSMNSAAYMFVRIAKIVNSLNCPGMLNGLLEELESRFIGQSWDLNWRFTLQCPTEQEYLSMVDKKSGSTFHMLVRLMQSASMGGVTLDFDSLAKLLGRWYQIRHEYLGLFPGRDSSGYGEDLEHAKITYPIVRCCNVDSSAKTVILGIFRQKAKGAGLSAETKVQILDLLYTTGAVQATYNLVQQLEREILTAVGELEVAAQEANPVLRSLVNSLDEIPPPTQGAS
ncbi:hypothetical protein EYZ11_001266 [Aspergillus tanneri]|uniref:Geranylgeranyl pyrophosphate synthase n=1 Tax=Aspergillus tanneri TaxID=1220188 RepID=A0A4S3JV47_9EURO|nr:Geranylgeranyl pyrophosphate synthase [Aspergillus tanneri]KAA8645751.1 Geranylgeranyl pyrophosphate synthase [Aspergillus tanneri]THC99267.1 hypothetical protein EYZ11_001266 [Aspergillus tanneri]